MVAPTIVPVPFFHMHFRKTFRFTVQDGAVDIVERLHEGGHGEAGGLGLGGGKTDMGDLGVRIGAPGDGQGRGFLAPHK